MLKKLIRIAATCGLLTAGYFGYSQGFALVSRQVGTPPRVPMLPYNPSDSRTKKEAIELALQAFGPGHWASKAKILYYESNRGFWIYTQEYDAFDNRKRMNFKPFALIWRDQRSHALKTMTSNEATVVFNHAPDMVAGNAGNEETRVMEATMLGDVRIRDDKGTPRQLGDDMKIAIDDLHYDGKTDTISSDKRFVYEERDTLATAEGLVIELVPADRPNQGGTNGYNGARTIRLLRDVRIAAQDVGETGIVPGGAPQKTKPGVKREPRPGEITCDGEMRIDLPLARTEPLIIGPPAPPAPTFAHFARNVRVRQGDAQAPEQIDCDRLHLTLLPAPPRPPAEADGSAPGLTVAQTVSAPNDPDTTEDPPVSGGPVANLALDRARATGHAVWLQSKVHGLIGRGNELTFRRGEPDQPDVTYFRGDRGTEIRRKNPTDGTEDVIRTTDVTLHKSSQGDGSMSVVARGPGRLETRRLADQVLLRSGTWQDQLVLQPVEGDPNRRLLTLDGRPELVDTQQGTMDATRKIVATLVSTPKPETAEAAKPPTPPSAEAAAQPEAAGASPMGAYRIELMQAWGTVHMVSNGPLPSTETEDGPAGVGSAARRTITAREWLGVVFEAPQEPTATSNPAVDGPVAENPANPAAPAAAATEEAPGPTDPAINVEADRIWAWLTPNTEAPTPATAAPAPRAAQPGSGGLGDSQGKWDVREVRLRGRVLVHQDAPPGKAQGMDVEGESIDVLNLGLKLYEVRAYGAPRRLARATTDEFLIEGPVIGLDQTKHTACVIGAGKLIQKNAGAGVLGDATSDPAVARTGGGADPAEDADPGKPAEPPRGPLTIVWGRDPDGQLLFDAAGKPVDSWMKFYGKPADERGGTGPARVQFHNGVRAWTRESVLSSSDMWAYFDGPIDFSKPPKSRSGGSSGTAPAPAPISAPARARARAESDAAPTTPPPQIARVVCERNVDAVTRKFNDDGVLTEKRHVVGQRLIYERNNNRFHVDSAGLVELWDRNVKLEPSAPEQPRRPQVPMASPGRPRVRPVAADGPRTGVIRPTAGRTRPAPKEMNPEDAPLRLTRIWFEDQMIGQLDTTRQDTKRRAGQAEFFGNVRVISAEVAQEDATLDPDAPPLDYLYTVSETLRVISEPPLPGAPEDAPDRILVQAWRDVYGLSARQGRSTALYTTDHMDYNSETGVSYVYGGDSGVRIVDQAGAGKQASYGGGSVVRYNHKTGEHHVTDVRGMQLVDPNSGIRAGIAPIPPENTKKPKPQRNLPRISPGDKERRNFNGGSR